MHRHPHRDDDESETRSMLTAAPFLCIAHRGASAVAPENTLAAFRLARELGAHGVELDVHCCEDAVVVIHDDDLARTTNGRGRVADTSLGRLRELDAGAGEPVPLLADVFEVLGPALGVNVELKGEGTAEPTIELLERLGVPPERTLLSSFDHEALKLAARLAPHRPRGALFGRGGALDVPAAIGAAQALGTRSIHIALADADDARVTALAESGLAVLVYTVNDVQRALRLRDAGAAGVFTDDPAPLLAALAGS